MIRSICVFCGSKFGRRPSYQSAAVRLGELAAAAGLEIVYGGGHVGLMGTVADAAMKAGGRVTGFIPERLLELEVGHRDISELIVTKAMSDRKDRMIEHSDAFAILPGGLGTLDELFEVLTLRQLGYHDKPIVLLNIENYWDPLLALIERTVDEDFTGSDVSSMISSVTDVDAFFTAIGVEVTSFEKPVTMPHSS